MYVVDRAVYVEKLEGIYLRASRHMFQAQISESYGRALQALPVLFHQHVPTEKDGSCKSLLGEDLTCGI